MSRIVFAGTPAIAAQALQSILEAGFHVAGVLTRPDAPIGRRRTLTPSPVAQAAEEANIPTMKADNVDGEASRQLSEWEPTLGVVIAYGALLPPQVLQVPTQGWVNLHYSALPKYRGAAPVQHAILSGEPTTAATIFQLEAGMDTGPIHGTRTYPIPEMTSSGAALTDLTDLGTQLLIDLLPALLDGTSHPAPQTGEPTFAPKLTREDAYIDPAQPAEALVQRINATIPEPGAWTLYGEHRLKLGVARLYEGEITASPGRVQEMSSDRAGEGRTVVLAAGDGRGIVLNQVQPAGKQMMNAADWLRGQQDTVHLGGERA